MPAPLISIITINLNNAKGLGATIKSVVNQTFKNYEFIVVDGASTDGSTQLINDYSKQITFSISEKDDGIYQAMNKGIKAAKGQYLLFLNSGDYLSDEHVLFNIQSHLHSADIICGDIDVFDDGRWHQMKSDDKAGVELFMRLSLYHQATFISKQLFDTYGLYDESFKSTGDYEFFIRVLLTNNASYKHIPIKISQFYADGMSNNPKFAEINKQERARSWQMHFSESSIKVFKDYINIKNSKELRWAKKINHYLPI